ASQAVSQATPQRPGRLARLRRDVGKLAPDRAQGALLQHERLDDVRVELAPRLAEDLAPRGRPAHCLAVRAVTRHRVERVRDGEDPRPEGNLGAADPIRVAAAVPALVMRADHPQALASEAGDAA